MKTKEPFVVDTSKYMQPLIDLVGAERAKGFQLTRATISPQGDGSYFESIQFYHPVSGWSVKFVTGKLYVWGLIDDSPRHTGWNEATVTDLCHLLNWRD